MKIKLLLAFCLSLLIPSANNAQETFTFSGYDGTGSAQIASTATANDNITIVIEDLDIIQNFYTENQTSIYLYGGLDTDSGPFQGAPDFNDVLSHPVVILVDGDASVGPNSYSITLNPTAIYSSVPPGTQVYGFNFLFQNQFGGFGNPNNQTQNLYIDLVDMETLSINSNSKENIDLKFKNNVLSIAGFNGKATVRAYNLLGEVIETKEEITVTNNYTLTLNLPRNQLSIIVFDAEKFKTTLKVLNY